jgi:NlpC/P60 family putative phage cell wall peptidase
MPTVSRTQVVECARSYSGTPWHHQARVKGLKGGVDCAGLIICVMRELELLDIEIPANYSAHPDGTLKPTCDRYLRPIPVNDAMPGDVLVFAFDVEPHHLGIVAQANLQATVIHSFAEARRVVENAIDPVWRPRIRGAYAIPGVE